MSQYICHDCKKIIYTNEKCMPYDARNKMYYKCEKCFEKDSVLSNYQPTEIYSRVVGYLRPVKQWNLGKKSEFEERKEYVINSQFPISNSQ